MIATMVTSNQQAGITKAGFVVVCQLGIGGCILRFCTVD